MKIPNQILLIPFISFLVLVIAWLDSFLLPKAVWRGWAGLLILLNALVLYTPWVIAIIATRHIIVNCVCIIGFMMIATGLFLLSSSLIPIARVPGQAKSFPEKLVVEGVYRFIRHPIYLSHFLVIGGWALAFGALNVFLEAPVVLAMAILGGKYEESKRLLPLFGKTFEEYRARTHFMMPGWAWAALAVIYAVIVLRVFFAF